jgi:hypothetical protein
MCPLYRGGGTEASFDPTLRTVEELGVWYGPGGMVGLTKCA